jgi:hypothetical protein
MSEALLSNQMTVRAIIIELRALAKRLSAVEEYINEFKHRYPRGDAAACASCGMPYCDFPCDMIIPDEEWRLISPTGDGGGLLCPNCICRLLADNGATCVKATGEGISLCPK